MNTLAETPVASHAPEVSIHQTAAATVAEIRAVAAPRLREWNPRRIKDIVVMIYAYGLLAFGMLFPLLLAAWAAFFAPAGS